MDPPQFWRNISLMMPRLVEPAIRAATSRASMSTGSTSTPSSISRLAPMPAKGLPESNPERAKKKR